MRTRHDIKRVELSAAERQALAVAAELYLDGMEDAKDLTAEDPSVQTAEELANLGNDLDNTRDALTKAKKKLEV